MRSPAPWTRRAEETMFSVGGLANFLHLIVRILLVGRGSLSWRIYLQLLRYNQSSGLGVNRFERYHFSDGRRNAALVTYQYQTGAGRLGRMSARGAHCASADVAPPSPFVAVGL